MSYPPALPAFAADATDESHLNLLAIFHYVVAGLTALFACFGLLYVVMGLAFINNPSMFNQPKQPMVVPATLPATWPTGATATANVQPMPPEFGWLFVGLGALVMLMGWLIAGLILYSGLSIRGRRRRVFSIVIAGLMCLSFPFGTVLGIFTIIVLVRPSVVMRYRAAA